MPTFDIVSLAEAESRSASGKRAQVTREYLEYLSRLKSGQAGKLEPSDGETAAAVRRRLGTAAKLAGRNLVIRRRGDQIYFWDKPGTGPRKRGRPRKIENILSNA